MTDLIGKYFDAELTEAEDAALSAQLESSEDAADRFVEKAEAVYFSYGLKEPREIGRWRLFGRASWVGWLLVAALLGGWGLWRSRVQTAPPMTPQVALSTEPVAKAQTTVLETSRAGGAKAKEREATKPDTRAHAAVVPTEVPTRTIAPARPMGPPPNPGFSVEARNLRVVVVKEATGALTVMMRGPEGTGTRHVEGTGSGGVVVRVLAANQVEVRRLYEGPLQTGKWAFQWDGVMSNGKMAPPGTYHIEVLNQP